MPRCLVCFHDLDGTEANAYHKACARRLFDRPAPPSWNLDLSAIDELGLAVLRGKGGLPGVQKKLSMDYETGSKRRMTIVGFQGSYILKPQTEDYPFLPENEAFCMELAEKLGIRTAPHGLVDLGKDGLAYLSRRFDRLKGGGKLHQEDFCQITQRPSADKYKGSLEAAAKALKHSSQFGLDAIRFLELNLFCWLSGNADMHLKNFSLYSPQAGRWELSPAYDLVSTALVLDADKEETALTLNGKKAGISLKDWTALALSLRIGEKPFQASISAFKGSLPLVEGLCTSCFLPACQKESFLRRWKERLERL